MDEAKSQFRRYIKSCRYFLIALVIISGGVSSIDDIKKAKELNNSNIEGIIVGKAIYDGDIKLEELAKELDA